MSLLIYISIINLANFIKADDLSSNLTEAILSIEEIRFGDRITAKYVTKIVILVPKHVSTSATGLKGRLESGLVQAVSLGAQRSQAQRYGLSAQTSHNSVNDDLQVKVLNITRKSGSEEVSVLFAVDYLGRLVLAKSVVQDLGLLTDSELSIMLEYAILSVHEYEGISTGEQGRLWIIGAVIGCVLGILLLGWCFLFAYYNACKPPTTDSNQQRNKKEEIYTEAGKKKYVPSTIITAFDDQKRQSNLKNTKMQTDIAGIKNFNERMEDDLNFLVPDDSNYSRISKTSSQNVSSLSIMAPSAPTGSKLINGNIRPTPLTPEVVIFRGDTGPSPDSSYQGTWTQSPEYKSTSKTVAKRKELDGVLGERWTPHLAGDTVQPYLQQLHPPQRVESLTAHPRPFPSSEAPSDDFPVFHSKDLMPHSATYSIPSSQMIRNAFFKATY